MSSRALTVGRERGRAAAAFYYISPFVSRCFVYQISDNCSRGRETFTIDFCPRDDQPFKFINMEILLGKYTLFMQQPLPYEIAPCPLSITSYQMPLSLPGDALGARARARVHASCRNGLIQICNKY